MIVNIAPLPWRNSDQSPTEAAAGNLSKEMIRRRNVAGQDDKTIYRLSVKFSGGEKLCLYIIGDGLRDALDPTMQGTR